MRFVCCWVDIVITPSYPSLASFRCRLQTGQVLVVTTKQNKDKTKN